MVDDEKELPTSLVLSAVTFLSELQQHYGADKSIEIWQAFGTAISHDVRSAVFTSMLGGHSRSFLIDASDCEKTIEAIKTVRAYSGIGLTEAKDIVCSIRETGRPGRLNAADMMINERLHLMRDLRSLGCIVKEA